MVRPSADLFLQSETFLHLGRVNGSIFVPLRSVRTFPKYRISGYGENTSGWRKISFDPNIRSDLWQSEALLRNTLIARFRWRISLNCPKKSCFHQWRKPGSARRIFISTTLFLTLLLITQGKNGVLVYFQGHLSTIPPNLFLSSIRPGQEMLCRWITCRSG